MNADKTNPMFYPCFTTVAFFKYSGSNVSPSPGPVGTGITPFTISKLGAYHDSFFGAARRTYSIHGAMFGVDAANVRMFTDAAPVCVLCGQIHMFRFRAIRATLAARVNP